jgi:hypothetical protein
MSHKNPMPPEWEALCAAMPQDDPLLHWIEELWDYEMVSDEIWKRSVSGDVFAVRDTRNLVLWGAHDLGTLARGKRP